MTFKSVPPGSPEQRLSLLAVVLLGACSSTVPVPPPQRAVDDKPDAVAVHRFWAIQDALARGADVDESCWRDLFSTPAYQWIAKSPAQRERIRNVMVAAFQPDREQAVAAAERAEGYAAVQWRHYLRIRDDRDALGDYLQQLETSNIIAEAVAIAGRHLPDGAVGAGEPVPQVHLAFFGPDAYGDGAVYLDLVQARDVGEDLVPLLAHEFHHVYYDALSPLGEVGQSSEIYWLVHALRQLHQEGLADRIDKQSFPIRPRGGGMPDYADEYNRCYREAPATLARFDQAVTRIARERERDRTAELAREAWSLLHYGAHPEGFFMANSIADAFGPEALTADVGNPFAFVRRFRAARPQDPLFSAETMAILGEIEAELLATPR